MSILSLFLTLSFISFSLADSSTQCSVNCNSANSNNYCYINCAQSTTATCVCSNYTRLPVCGCAGTLGGDNVLSFYMAFQYGLYNSFSNNEMMESIRTNFTSLATSYWASCRSRTQRRLSSVGDPHKNNSVPRDGGDTLRSLTTGERSPLLATGSITCLSQDKNSWVGANILCNSQLQALCYCDQNGFPFCKCLGGSPTDKTIKHYIYQLHYADKYPIRVCELLDFIEANASAIANDYGGDCAVGLSFCH